MASMVINERHKHRRCSHGGRKFLMNPDRWTGNMVLVVLFSIILGFPVYAETAISSGEVQDRIKSITPDYPAPLQDVFDVSARPGLPLRLLGVDLLQGGRRLQGKRVRLDSTIPLTIRAYWCPRLRLNTVLEGQALFQDQACVISRKQVFRIGPEKRNMAWEIGQVYCQQYTMDLQEVARAWSGYGFLSITMPPLTREGKARICVQLLPVLLTPLVETREISLTTLGKFVTPPYRIFPVHIRLEAGAVAHLDIPKIWRQGNRRLVLLSAMSYRDIKQGEPVGTIVLDTEKNGAFSLVIRSGKDTALCNYDALRSEQVDHDQVQIFDSWDSRQLDSRGNPSRLHRYITVRTLPQDAEKRSLTGITIRCEADTVFDVYGLVLLDH